MLPLSLCTACLHHKYKLGACAMRVSALFFRAHAHCSGVSLR
jgi:hypothetical protein